MDRLNVSDAERQSEVIALEIGWVTQSLLKHVEVLLVELRTN